MQPVACSPLQQQDTYRCLAHIEIPLPNMYPSLVSAAPLVFAGLFGFLLSPVLAAEVPSSGLTITELIASLDPDIAANSNWNISNASSIVLQPDITKRSYAFLNGKLFTASYNASDGYGGYNISIPGDICADSVVGDLLPSSGQLIPNATFADFYNATDLPSDELTNDTMTRALALQTTLNTTLTNVICPPLPDRELLFRYNPSEVDGFWSAFVLAGLGVAGIGFAGLHEAIVRQSQGSISVNQEVWILTATALAQYLVITIIFRLQHVRAFSRGEAFIYNTFIAIGEQIAAGCAFTWSKTCAAPTTLRSGLSQLRRATVKGIQGFQARTLGSGGPSSLNLVGQDLEQGQQGEGSQCE